MNLVFKTIYFDNDSSLVILCIIYYAFQSIILMARWLEESLTNWNVTMKGKECEYSLVSLLMFSLAVYICLGVFQGFLLHCTDPMILRLWVSRSQ